MKTGGAPRSRPQNKYYRPTEGYFLLELSLFYLCITPERDGLWGGAIVAAGGEILFLATPKPTIAVVEDTLRRRARSMLWDMGRRLQGLPRGHKKTRS